MRIPVRVALVLTMIVSAASAAAQSAGPNISGVWVLDVANSNFGPMPAPTADSMVITRSGGMYHVDQYTTLAIPGSTAQGPGHVAANWPAHDDTVTNVIPSQAGPAQVHSTVKIRGDTLTFSGTVDIQGQQVATQSGREFLSPDGKTLTREVAIQVMMGGATTPMTVTEVYHRK